MQAHVGWPVGRGWMVAALAALMLLPVIAIRAVDAIDWNAADAIFLAGLLAGSVAAAELAARLPLRFAYRAGIALAIFAGLVQAWVNLAVGIIGSEDNPANRIYFAVLAVAAVGALAARLRPAAMARAMVAAATAQGLVFAVALIAGAAFTGPITAFFIALWLSAAALFRRSAAAGAG